MIGAKGTIAQFYENLDTILALTKGTDNIIFLTMKGSHQLTQTHLCNRN